MKAAKITPDTIVALLNEINDIDSEAMKGLVNRRVICNEDLANHPNVVVSADKDYYRIGLLGVLNGLMTEDKVICAVVSDDGTIKEFRVIDKQDVKSGNRNN